MSSADMLGTACWPRTDGCYIGIVENTMETTVSGLGFRIHECTRVLAGEALRAICHGLSMYKLELSRPCPQDYNQSLGSRNLRVQKPNNG